MSGAAVAGQCFTDFGLAAAVACSNFSGVTNTGTINCSSVNSFSVSGASVTMISWPAGGSSGTSYSQSIYYPSCDPLTVVDGVLVGMSVGVVWIVVASVLYLRKVLT